MTYAEIFSKRIRYLCEKQNISINKLALSSGLSRTTVYNIVNGKTKHITLRSLCKISKGFGITVSSFCNIPELNNLALVEKNKK